MDRAVVVVSAVCGSSGDVAPCLAIAGALRAALPRADVRVCALANPVYERAVDEDVEFVGVGSAAASRKLMEGKGARGRALVDLWTSVLEAHAEALRALARQSRRRVTVLAHTLDVAVRCLEESESDSGSFACYSIVLSPALVRFPRIGIPPFLGELVGCLRPRRLAERAADFLVDMAFAPRLNAFRASLGLAPVRRGIFKTWFLCRGGSFCMYPEAFARAPTFVSAQVGFPLQPRVPTSRELDVVNFVRDYVESHGVPTVVFVSASGNPPFATKFFSAAADAMTRLGSSANAIFLTMHRDRLPDLPSNSIHLEYLPLDACHDVKFGLFVSHGTIGCISNALVAAWPQIVCPACWDQPYNCELLQSMGKVARVIPISKLRGKKLSHAIEKTFADESVREEATRIAQKLQHAVGGASVVAEIIAKAIYSLH